jgi:hypothetical protein
VGTEGNKVILSPKTEAREEAADVSVLEYCRLDPDHPSWIEDQMSDKEREAVGVVTLSRLKQCLNEGYPAVFLFKYYWEDPPWLKHSDTQGNRTLSYLGPLPAAQRNKRPSEDNGGHIVLAIGYDDTKQVIFCQNSWGGAPPSKPVAGSPIFAMSYSWVTGESILLP